jgi:hypothetical protein
VEEEIFWVRMGSEHTLARLRIIALRLLMLLTIAMCSMHVSTRNMVEMLPHLGIKTEQKYFELTVFVFYIMNRFLT